MGDAGLVRRCRGRRPSTTPTWEWTHPVGEVVTALIEAGLELRVPARAPDHVVAALPVPRASRRRHLSRPADRPSLPMIYSLGRDRSPSADAIRVGCGSISLRSHDVRLRVRPRARPPSHGAEGPAGRQGRQPGRDDLGARPAGAARASRSRPMPSRAYMVDGWPAGLDDEVAASPRQAREGDGQAARRPGRPAAGERALGGQVLDARDDGHRLEPRPERRVGEGARRSRRTTSASPTTRTVGSSRCTARSCSTSPARSSTSCFEAARERAGRRVRCRDPGRRARPA